MLKILSFQEEVLGFRVMDLRFNSIVGHLGAGGCLKDSGIGSKGRHKEAAAAELLSHLCNQLKGGRVEEVQVLQQDDERPVLMRKRAEQQHQ